MHWIFTPAECREVRLAVSRIDGLTVQQYAERLGYTDRDSAYRIEQGVFRPNKTAADAMMKELDRLYRRKAFANLADIRRKVRDRTRRLG